MVDIGVLARHWSASILTRTSYRYPVTADLTFSGTTGRPNWETDTGSFWISSPKQDYSHGQTLPGLYNYKPETEFNGVQWSHKS